MPFTYPEALQELLDVFEEIEDRSERFDMLIYWSDKYKRADTSITGPKPYAEMFKVPSCESQAYAWSSERSDGTLEFHFVVENPQGLSAKALSAILTKTLSGSKPEEIKELKSVEIVQKLFGSKMGMVRTQGLRGIVKMTRAYAIQVLNKKTHS